MKALIIITSFLLLSQTNYNSTEKPGKINNYDFDRCTIANESTSSMSKFEIDLSCCGIDDVYQNPQNPEIRSLLWLSVISKSSSEVSGGVYKFSNKRIDERKPMTFSGKIRYSGNETDITDGKIVIKNYDNKIKILYKLKFKDGNKIEGQFFGDFSLHLKKE